MLLAILDWDNRCLFAGLAAMCWNVFMFPEMFCFHFECIDWLRYCEFSILSSRGTLKTPEVIVCIQGLFTSPPSPPQCI